MDIHVPLLFCKMVEFVQTVLSLSFFHHADLSAEKLQTESLWSELGNATGSYDEWLPHGACTARTERLIVAATGLLSWEAEVICKP